jgi:hypothetical protein
MSNSAAAAACSALVELFPYLHCWDGKNSHGGIDRWMLTELFKFLEGAGLAQPGKRYLETGAGLSTLLFLCTQPASINTICLEQPDFFDRLDKARRQLSLPAEPLIIDVGFSEVILPRIVLGKEAFCDFCLIDGGHGWPTVFVDFCYAAYAMKQYGYLAIDDTHLYSVQQLVALLSEQPGWIKVQDLGKLVIFQKQYVDRVLPDFGGQPYIGKMSRI